MARILTDAVPRAGWSPGATQQSEPKIQGEPPDHRPPDTSRGLERGGKTPMIVFDYADLDTAVPALVTALVVFNGQFCMTGSRVLVQRGIADELRRRLTDRLEHLRVGPAADPASELGPVIDRRSVERIDAIVEAAIAAGATPLVRGGPIRQGPLANGAFYRATADEWARHCPDCGTQARRSKG
ncbi:aldehyde dehydrogenase family protein [Streptomyces sp. NPDC058231]|uniref:aldehyde dehydrogenase family protein n=1 Tax=Streptomyces sp. NPDC058231 TaxID=3346392 RepID=UPI0036E964CD